ncbi:MAG TPA: hypothetical protein VFC63_19435 [Blastocatellia bacterium]|nr:hypothetical protein [Blastocatellia bacterium]
MNVFIPAQMVAILLLVAIQAVAQTPGAGKPDNKNSYPLTESQKQAIKKIKSEAEKKAAPLATRLASIVKQDYQDMLADKSDEKLRERLTVELKDVTWQLLAIKGQTMRDAVHVLTANQKEILKREMIKPGAPADLMELIDKIFDTDVK